MKTRTRRWCWRKDLAEFRGISEMDRRGFLLVLEWFENFRLRHEMKAGTEAVRCFWRAEVLRTARPQEHPREPWQLEQWERALRWYLNWLQACAAAQADHRSLPERVRGAVQAAGARRGLALTTKRCYGGWAARFAKFAGDEREVMQVAVASRFLESVVADEDCAYSTQKQALNAVAFFFKHVCGVEDPVFEVKLCKTGRRVPVVLSKGETRQVFAQLERRGRADSQSSLAARVQYGAGLRRSELVRLRITARKLLSQGRLYKGILARPMAGEKGVAGGKGKNRGFAGVAGDILGTKWTVFGRLVNETAVLQLIFMADGRSSPSRSAKNFVGCGFALEEPQLGSRTRIRSSSIRISSGRQVER